jgi:hypothetical protein
VEINAESVSASQASMSSLQLKQLLINIKDHAPQTCIRYRLEGEMWLQQFVKVIMVNDHRVFVLDEAQDRLLSVPISPIIQIELDHTFRQYQPHNHYDVMLEKA